VWLHSWARWGGRQVVVRAVRWRHDADGQAAEPLALGYLQHELHGMHGVLRVLATQPQPGRRRTLLVHEGDEHARPDGESGGGSDEEKDGTDGGEKRREDETRSEERHIELGYD
jgi:hypothetical protein